MDVAVVSAQHHLVAGDGEGAGGVAIAIDVGETAC